MSFSCVELYSQMFMKGRGGFRQGHGQYQLPISGVFANIQYVEYVDSKGKFSLMVLYIEFTNLLFFVGDSGLGKSTLINSLFLTDLYKDRQVLGTAGND